MYEVINSSEENTSWAFPQREGGAWCSSGGKRLEDKPLKEHQVWSDHGGVYHLAGDLEAENTGDFA
jgi:hypothetical protein